MKILRDTGPNPRKRNKNPDRSLFDKARARPAAMLPDGHDLDTKNVFALEAILQRDLYDPWVVGALDQAKS